MFNKIVNYNAIFFQYYFNTNYRNSGSINHELEQNLVIKVYVNSLFVQKVSLEDNCCKSRGRNSVTSTKCIARFSIVWNSCTARWIKGFVWVRVWRFSKILIWKVIKNGKSQSNPILFCTIRHKRPMNFLSDAWYNRANHNANS